MTIAFIIEGINEFFDSHPEIGLTRTIAESLHAKTVDIIQSFNQAHIAAMLRKLPRNDWPAFVAVCIDFLSKSYVDNSGFIVNGYPVGIITRRIIVPGFESLVLAGELVTPPQWLTDLNDGYDRAAYSVFLNRVIQERFENSMPNYHAFSQDILEQSLELSNTLSAQQLLTFLHENQEVTHIYALIGASHLPIAEALNVEIIKKENNIRKLKLTLDAREVIIELHGGTHGKMDNYHSLCQSLTNEGIISHIPQQSTTPSSLHDVYPLTKKQILANYLYLFFVELIAIPKIDSEASISRESGCEKAMLNAYLHAFQHKKEIITHDFLKKTNKLVLAHLKNESAGRYRSGVGKYPIKMQKLDNIQDDNDFYSGTVEGLYDFINYWIHKGKIIHSMDFTCIAEPDQGSAICALRDKPIFFKLNPLTMEHFTVQKYNHFIREASQDKGYIIEVGLFTMDMCVNNPEEKEAIIEQKMHILWSEYNDGMQEAHTDEQKTVCITQYIQRIAQLRPFYDGNIRTCYVLLNKLLHDHGLSLTLLLNARRFSGCTLMEVVEMVKTGQIIYQQLLQHASVRMPFVFHTNDSLITIQTISCESKPFPQEILFDSFYDKVIFNQIAETGISLQQPASFFYHPHRMIDERLVLGCDAPPGSVIDLDGRTVCAKMAAIRL